MHRRKSKKILFYLFLLLFVGSINNIQLNKLEFNKIEKISISGLEGKENRTLLKNLNKLNLENIFFISDQEIGKIIEKNSLVENYSIFKKYPSSLKIQIKKTNLLARINKNGEIFIVGSNGKLIKNKKLDKYLPYIFGKPNIENFLQFKSIIDKSKISYDKIKNLYYFPSNRWDLQLKNSIVIKLSKNNLKKKLDHAFVFIDDNQNIDFKIIDMRVNNQIIVND